jgi:acetyl esterase/lipase
MIFLRLIIGLWIFTAAVAQAQTLAYMPERGAASPALDIYSFAGAQRAPVMVYVHGGAWVTGDKSRVHEKGRFFSEAGFVFVSVNYTLLPEGTVEGQLQEMDAALGFIANNIANAGGDPNNIHPMGHSTGAYIVSMTAVRPLQNAASLLQSGALRSVIANDTRAYNLPRIAQINGGSLTPAFARPFGSNPASWAAYSPQNHVNSGNLPAFLVAYSGQGDNAVRASFALEFAEVLRQAGAEVQTYDGGGYSHAEINKTIGVSAGITNAISGFLQQQR